MRIRFHGGRRLLPIGAILILVGLFFGHACASSSPGDAGGERPNIVLIISDDQTYSDFGFMGDEVVQTPHIDRLAAASARYVNGYVPASVCRPSLATLLTGLYPHEHGIHFNHPPPGNRRLGQMPRDTYYAARRAAVELFKRSPSLPHILARHGYASLQTGKFWEGHYRNAGFTHGMTTGRAAGVPGCWDKTLPDGARVAHGNGDIGLIIGRETMQPIAKFLDAHPRTQGRPFLLWYAPVLPHTPHNAPPKYLDLYRDDPRVAPHFVPYYANCSWFDDTVGELIGMLQARDLLENTLILFVVDNGWTPAAGSGSIESGYPVNRRSKRSPFEDGLRTPILIRWDGHVEPATHRTLVSTVDVVPTLLHAVGLGAEAEGMSGINLMPSATGTTRLDPDRAVCGEIYPGDASVLGAPARDVAYRWIRRGPWKLIVPHGHGGQAPWGGYLQRPALLHVERDPTEQKNLIDAPEHAERVEQLRTRLDAWWLPEDG